MYGTLNFFRLVHDLLTSVNNRVMTPGPIFRRDFIFILSPDRIARMNNLVVF